MAKFITMKTTPEALKLLRILAATTGKMQFEIMERLLNAEADRIGLPKHLREGKGE